MPDERPSSRRAPDRLVPLAAALASSALVIGFFSPRFVLWQGVDLTSSHSLEPEINRAVDTLRQLEDPFVRIESPYNRVINWRLLFPLLGHYLHLPAWAFLALPHLGALLVLGYSAHLVRREGGDRWVAFAASALVATASWFFVSTGWLAYFDSWCLLGVLVVAFSPSAAATAVACLLAPWVDERFVLTLPLGLVVRWVGSGWAEGGRPGKLRAEVLRMVALVALYCALRLVALACARDEVSAAHLRSHLAPDRDFRQLLDGLWMGLRGLWLFVGVPAWILLRQGRVARAGAVSLAVVATVVAGVLVANDLSRSTSMLIPVALLGMVLLLRERPVEAKRLLPVVLVFNLLTPARHVILSREIPIGISPLHVELDHYLHPPPYVSRLHDLRALELVRRGLTPEALREIDIAIRLNPDSADSRLIRAICLTEARRSAEAAESFDAAVRLAPDRADIYRLRGHFHRTCGLLPAAARDLRKALELRPANAPERPAVERELADILRQSGGP
jgi:hypothetical protein